MVIQTPKKNIILEAWPKFKNEEGIVFDSYKDHVIWRDLYAKCYWHCLFSLLLSEESSICRPCTSIGFYLQDNIPTSMLEGGISSQGFFYQLQGASSPMSHISVTQVP